MKHLDLFSGIGGFSLAAQWVWKEEHEIVAFVEIDEFCQKVLKKHWPDVPIIEDIRDVTKETLADTDRKRFNGKPISIRKEQKENIEINRSSKVIDLLSGGFPCQPFSQAGKRKGKDDNRYLWPEMLRVISETLPHWVIGENVAGILNMGFEHMLSDLESIGYEIETFVIPACAVNAPHRRDRVWIVGYSNKQRLPESARTRLKSISCQTESSTRSESCRAITEIGTNWTTEPNVGRVAHGIPNRVDRLKSLGNAIVPQVVVLIMEAIKQIENRFSRTLNQEN